MKVMMVPHLSQFGGAESGIRRVVEAYFRYGREYGIEFADPSQDSFDLLAVHAGMTDRMPLEVPLVSHCHGLYWTADYQAAGWEWHTNKDVIRTLRHATSITVPSAWVAETIARDMHIYPHVLPHGIEFGEWQHDEPNVGYVLWNKNRAADVCDPSAIGYLAQQRQDVRFVSTFAPRLMSGNIAVIGVRPHDEMKRLIQRAGVYLSTAKETFCIGDLEAMASGVPILGYAHGGNLGLIEHGINGYLAQPNNLEDLLHGLDYCLSHRAVLGANGREMAKRYTWQGVVNRLYNIYESAMQRQPATASIVIPSYNYADKVGRAIESAMAQDYPLLESIVVVDDGSNDDGATGRVVAELSAKDKRVIYHRQENAGVANARNAGIRRVSSKYIACLDADDAIKPGFLSATVPVLEADPSLGIAYTGLWYIKPDGQQGLSPWPPEFDYDKQLIYQNQIPTCCTFRREMWARLGGYRQRYAPGGAGAEDGEFWLRSGAYGWGARKATGEGLFVYSWLSGRVSGNPKYRQPDYLAWHPWASDKKHPFASLATPADKKPSHAVRQYDQPVISVVIPVGPGHEHEIINALDSLEAQTFRKWEAIVVWDSPDASALPEHRTAYPFVRFEPSNIVEGKSRGAGAARNLGVSKSRAPFLVFLDADDWLYPKALESMLDWWQAQGEAIVYTDYVGKAYLDDPAKLAPNLQSNVLEWDEKTGLAVIRYRPEEYDCDRAIQQPVFAPDGSVQDVYHWANITCLIPRAWHDHIGGFDESMLSWEDVDYHWRFAKAGYCYSHLPQELLVYRFYSGGRRQSGLQNHEKLLQYLHEKHKEIAVMGCRSCGGGRQKPTLKTPVVPAPQASGSGQGEKLMQDTDFIMCTYIHPSTADHAVVGGATKIKYNYRRKGDVFLVHRDDVAAQPHLFIPVQAAAPAPPPPPPPPPPVSSTPPPPPPRAMSAPEKAPDIIPVANQSANSIVSELLGAPGKPKEAEAQESAPPPKRIFRLETIPGMTPGVLAELQKINKATLDGILELGIDGLKGLKGVGETRAGSIYRTVKKYKEQSSQEQSA